MMFVWEGVSRQYSWWLHLVLCSHWCSLYSLVLLHYLEKISVCAVAAILLFFLRVAMLFAFFQSCGKSTCSSKIHISIH